MKERKPKQTPMEEERPRGRGARAVADIVPHIGRAAFRRFGFVQSSVVSRWPEIVGPRYAGVTTPESIRFPPGRRSEGVLTLSVDGAHGPMLQHVAPAIVERVNRFFGYPAVARVAIRQGPPLRPTPRRAVPAPQPVPAELGESLRTIGDPELRDCLAALAGALAASSGPPVFASNDKE
ncbi:DUF721 domain-containing protein [Sphingomonas oleivorans]|nr:DciA family protein [Sphingomonas oleivorans]